MSKTQELKQKIRELLRQVRADYRIPQLDETKLPNSTVIVLRYEAFEPRSPFTYHMKLPEIVSMLERELIDEQILDEINEEKRQNYLQKIAQ